MACCAVAAAVMVLTVCVSCASSLEGSNQIVSDQGVRKNLYQKVRHNTELVSWQAMGMG